MDDPCQGCQHVERCRDDKIACQAMAFKGEQGDNPNKLYYDKLFGLGIDYHNVKLAEDYKQNGFLSACEYILLNVPMAQIHKLSFPKEQRNDFLYGFSAYLPIEKLKTVWLDH